MVKKYYIWIAFGSFIILAGLLLAFRFNFFAKRADAPTENMGVAEENYSPESDRAKAPTEIDIENSNADFEADIEDFGSDLENWDDFDEDINLDSFDDEELL